METSLRHGGDYKAMGIHVKKKFPLLFGAVLKVNGELNTKTGDPTHVKAMIRKFIPDLYSTLGWRLEYDPYVKLRYSARVKTSFPVTASGLLRVNIKGWYDIDKEFKEKKPMAAAEFTWGILGCPKYQERWLKVGCQASVIKKDGYEVEFTDNVPYLRIRGNSWTLKADINGKWNVRYDF